MKWELPGAFPSRRVIAKANTHIEKWQVAREPCFFAAAIASADLSEKQGALLRKWKIQARFILKVMIDR